MSLAGLVLVGTSHKADWRAAIDVSVTQINHSPNVRRGAQVESRAKHAVSTYSRPSEKLGLR